MSSSLALTKIVSGGQTGSDFGGLLAGKALGLETGGHAPRGWLIESEDGRRHIPAPWLADYGLKEHPTPTGDIPKPGSPAWLDFYVKAYVYRTESNARDSHATLWFGGDEDSRGCKKTESSCRKHKRPFLKAGGLTPSDIRSWLVEHEIGVLNVAGNRESKKPEKYRDKPFSEVVRDFLIKTIKGYL